MSNQQRFKRAYAVANTAAGSVGAGAPEILAQIFAEHGIEAEVRAAQPATLGAELSAAVAAKPDLLVVLAGDGTARRAAELAGPDGPVLAPLPGGTLNMLPRAIYGERDWRSALSDSLARPRIIDVGGGTVEDHAFFVAAILGAPALWATAREAVREGKPLKAVERARLALKRAFSSRLRYRVGGEAESKTEALAILCPLISPMLDSDEQSLEIAALDPSGLGDAVRIGLLASVGRWRDDPSVHLHKARTAFARAHRAIPAIVDGETISIGREARIRFNPRAFRALTSAD